MQEFIDLIAHGAQVFQMKTGVFASTTIAQAILETGGGTSLPVDKYNGKKSNNLFGVKGTGTAGSVVCDTWEVYDGKRVDVEDHFRAYNSIDESVEDHGKLLLLPRYKPVREAVTPEEQCRQLYLCGYATDAPKEVDGDPAYWEKLIDIINAYDLKRYDDISHLDDTPSEWAVKAVEKAKAKKVIVGGPDGKFRPKDLVTREELAVILDRLSLLD